jgi:hypothetical protein
LEDKLQDRRWVTELAFGQEMEIWNYKGTYPLEVISLVVIEDEKGKYYYPIIDTYTDGDQLISGNRSGFRSRSAALGYVGKCWDIALNENHL